MRTLEFSSSILLGILALPASAQLPEPHLGYAYPAGAERGASARVVLGGQHLQGPRRVLFEGKGLEARILHYCKPPNRGQLNRLRQKIREWLLARHPELGRKDRRRDPKVQAKLRRMRANPFAVLDEMGPEVFKRIARSVRLNAFDLDDLKRFLPKFRDPKRQPNAQIEETLTLEVSVAPDARPGLHELRVETNRGLSNPILFEVGQYGESLEREPNDERPDTSACATLPCTINGQILPGDVDRFAFFARKGTRIVAAAQARRLVPYLADAVPGWFQAVMTLYDEAGNRIALVDDFKFDPDPVLSFKAPKDGTYVLEIRDSIYRGREDFVYRITIGRIPFVTGVFPLGGRPGQATSVKLSGWNLSKPTATVVPGKARDGRIELRFRQGRRLSNPIRFGVDPLVPIRAREPDDSPDQARKVELPVLIDGRIEHPGDLDVFRFEGKAGEWITAEVRARRLGSPLDSLLEILDARGRRLAFNDDFVDKGAGLTTHHADSRLRIRLPEDGTYMIRLGDAQHHGGPDAAYRLRIAPSRPDFALRVTPASLSIPPGGFGVLTVHALRLDGFDGDIRLSLLDPPPGFRLDGAWVPKGVDKIELTLGAPRKPQAPLHSIRIVGRAALGEEIREHEAIPAEDMMQAFLYRHLVPAEKLLVKVPGRARRGRTTPRLAEPGPVLLPLDGGRWVRFTGLPKANALPRGLSFELHDAPKGMSLVKTEVPEDGMLAFLLRPDPASLKAGTKGNLILRIYLTRTLNRPGAPRRTRRIFAGNLPAIPFEVIRRL